MSDKNMSVAGAAWIAAVVIGSLAAFMICKGNDLNDNLAFGISMVVMAGGIGAWAVARSLGDK